MPLNIITFFIFYNLILFSVLGYGFFVSKIFFKNTLKKNLGFVGLFGLFFLCIYSYFSHLLIPHGYIHNVFILLIGLFLFICLIKDFDLLSFKILIIIFLFLFLILLLFKTHDDFPYYHFPYSYYINQH